MFWLYNKYLFIVRTTEHFYLVIIYYFWKAINCGDAINHVTPTLLLTLILFPDTCIFFSFPCICSRHFHFLFFNILLLIKSLVLCKLLILPLSSPSTPLSNPLHTSPHLVLHFPFNASFIHSSGRPPHSLRSPLYFFFLNLLLLYFSDPSLTPPCLPTLLSFFISFTFFLFSLSRPRPSLNPLLSPPLPPFLFSSFRAAWVWTRAH